MSAADIDIPRKVWTRADLDKIDPALAESLELINGDLLETMGKKPPHTYWKQALRDWLGEQFGYQYVQSEDPIDVSSEDNPTNEPEPDLILTLASWRTRRGEHPKPEDIRLLIEISDTTYRLDTKVKADLYARADIREYWVLDIRDPEAPSLLIHRDPHEGHYRTQSKHIHFETIFVLEGRSIRLGDLG